MKIQVPLSNGYLPDAYTKHASAKYQLHHHPITSFPITFEDVPKTAVSLALVLLDDDAIPVCGFTYIHWVAANLPATLTELPENASQSDIVAMTHGNNSLAGNLVQETDPRLFQHYLGPMPPDKEHQYQLTVYAVDQKLPLTDGFWLNQLYQQLEGHVLASASIKLPVKN
ncbi:YbhB/YbcL family Raf kinase inhibitor-like protein [Fructilactobacillus florum]|nr:YbhB/YbcL family Raf kinase inhibitor-like protein [Fructilactobacillus florum]